MGVLHIENVDDQLLERLCGRADANGSSIEDEVLDLLRARFIIRRRRSGEGFSPLREAPNAADARQASGRIGNEARGKETRWTDPSES